MTVDAFMKDKVKNMKGEIDRDFYCSAERFDFDDFFCIGSGVTCSRGYTCNAYHRKHPTPEQYKQEYGEDYPDDGAVYLYKGVLDSYDGSEPRTATYSWTITSYDYVKGFRKHSPMLVGQVFCACTPFGKPDADWRPE